MNGIRVIKIVHPDLFRSCRRRAVTPRLGRSIANVQIKLRIDPILGTNPRTVLTMNMTRIQSQNSARPARPVKQKYFLVKMLMKLPSGPAGKTEVFPGQDVDEVADYFLRHNCFPFRLDGFYYEIDKRFTETLSRLLLPVFPCFPVFRS